MKYKVKIKKMKARPIVSIRYKCTIPELSQKLGQTMMNVINYLGTKNIPPRGAPVAIFHETRDQQTDVEAGIPVAGPIEVEGQIKNSQTPEGKAAFTLYTGGYDKIAPAYDTITSWLQEKGIKGSGVWWEIYLSDPRKEPDQNKWKTEIYQLLD